MGIPVFDKLSNLVTGLGQTKDRNRHLTYGCPIITPDQLVNAYRGDWIARKAVNIPAFDMVRAWRNLQAEDTLIEAVEAEERRLQVRRKVKLAKQWERLFGGAALILGVDQGDASQPLRVESLGKGALQYIHVVSRYEISEGERDRDLLSPSFGHPLYYTLSGRTGTQARIHPSRVIRFGGCDVPEFGRTDTWGDSVLLAVDEAIKNAGLTAASIAGLVNEAKVDVYKVKGLSVNAKDEAWTQRMLARFALANDAKSNHNALIVDSEEEWEQKTLSFAQLPEILRLKMQIAAGAVDIPATRFLSQAPEGMNSTGESDTRNYYDRLSADQELDLRPSLEQLDAVMVRSAVGTMPDDYYWTFAPLWQLSETERATNFKMKADAARAIAGTGGASPPLMPIEALSDALVNTFVEDGSLPGLEAAIEEYGKLSEQDDETAEEEVEPAPRVAANDAAPRTLYVQRKLLNAPEFLAWARGQGFSSTLAADDLHVTVLFSRRPVDWMKMGDMWSGDSKGNVMVSPGGPRLVEPLGDKGAVVLLFSSTDLQWRHRSMIEAGASHDYDEYQPHVTITYEGKGLDLSKVEPYRGKLVFGPEIFEELNTDWSPTLSA